MTWCRNHTWWLKRNKIIHTETIMFLHWMVKLGMNYIYKLMLPSSDHASIHSHLTVEKLPFPTLTWCCLPFSHISFHSTEVCSRGDNGPNKHAPTEFTWWCFPKDADVATLSTKQVGNLVNSTLSTFYTIARILHGNRACNQKSRYHCFRILLSISSSTGI
jgi:hypothetical protein